MSGRLRMTRAEKDALAEAIRRMFCYREIEEPQKTTVNAVPAVHGRWIEYPECLGYTGAYSEHHIVCSECHDVWNIMDNDTENFNFCPHCGAEMDGERTNE